MMIVHKSVNRRPHAPMILNGSSPPQPRRVDANLVGTRAGTKVFVQRGNDFPCGSADEGIAYEVSVALGSNQPIKTKSCEVLGHQALPRANQLADFGDGLVSLRKNAENCETMRTPQRAKQICRPPHGLLQSRGLRCFAFGLPDTTGLRL